MGWGRPQQWIIEEDKQGTQFWWQQLLWLKIAVLRVLIHKSQGLFRHFYKPGLPSQAQDCWYEINSSRVVHLPCTAICQRWDRVDTLHCRVRLVCWQMNKWRRLVKSMFSILGESWWPRMCECVHMNWNPIQAVFQSCVMWHWERLQNHQDQDQEDLIEDEWIMDA